MSSIPGSVVYKSQVHSAYDCLGSFEVLWVHMANDTKIVLKNSDLAATIFNSIYLHLLKLAIGTEFRMDQLLY